MSRKRRCVHVNSALSVVCVSEATALTFASIEEYTHSCELDLSVQPKRMTWPGAYPQLSDLVYE